MASISEFKAVLVAICIWEEKEQMKSQVGDLVFRILHGALVASHVNYASLGQT